MNTFTELNRDESLAVSRPGWDIAVPRVPETAREALRPASGLVLGIVIAVGIWGAIAGAVLVYRLA